VLTLKEKNGRSFSPSSTSIPLVQSGRSYAVATLEITEINFRRIWLRSEMGTGDGGISHPKGSVAPECQNVGVDGKILERFVLNVV
jgi:hypothetical protein